MRCIRRASVAAIVAALALGGAGATTKGLNQIVTPDIQPAGVLSLSFQAEHEAIGNPLQLQLEYGISNRFEVAAFQGFRPNEVIVAAEYGLLAKGPYLLSTGFGNWTDLGDKPQPYLIGGYYRGPHRVVIGASRTKNHTESVLGYAFQTTPRLLLQADYQSGSGNSLTAGFTYALSPQLGINPSLYLTNDSPHRILPYVVISWNIKVR